MSTRDIVVERINGAERVRADDRVAVEEPLDIRVDDDTLAITMRTPGQDRELVLGFLVSEGIVRRRDDVSSIANCGRPGDPGYANTIAVVLGPSAQLPPSERVRRGTLTSSACGVCGRKTIDDLLARIRSDSNAKAGGTVTARTILESMWSLRDHQPTFDKTGGVHAAALFGFDGRLIVTHEDVGRHNAVDKVVGSRFLAEELGAPDRLLVVSGRSSFEIVQKAISAGFAAVASVSAPSSLAVQLAAEANLILAGFVRGEKLVIYSGQDRVV